MTTGITQASLDVIGHSGVPEQRFSTVNARVLGTWPDPEQRVTAASIDVLGTMPAPMQRFTQVDYVILATRTPNYRFQAVILPDVFPYDISYNSVGSIRFATDVIVVDSGDDQRNQRWDQPLMEYDISYGVRTLEQVHALQAFFRAMRGRAYAFNYKDPIDHSSSTASVIEARSSPPTTPFDQQIGIGDSISSSFQLSKLYRTATGASEQRRPITRPNAGTVKIAIDSEVYTQFTVDPEFGIVTLQSPVSTVIGAHAVTKDAAGNGNTATFTGRPGDFLGFVKYANKGRVIAISGCSNSENNVAIANHATIQGVPLDGSWMIVQYPPGYGGPAETTTGMTFTVSPAPTLGQIITAGFEFYVPVRFDTDTLPVQLEEYGIGSSNSIKLIEVRKSAF